MNGLLIVIGDVPDRRRSSSKATIMNYIGPANANDIYYTQLRLRRYSCALTPFIMIPPWYLEEMEVRTQIQ